MSTEIKKATNLDQVRTFAQRSKAESERAAKAAVNALTLPTKVSELTNDSKFQTEEQVTAAVEAKISSVYRPGGSVAFDSLPAADEAHLGMVYNITDAFTTTDSFLEGAGKEYPAGTNVVIAADGEGYKYDALAGLVDLTPYAKSADVVAKEEGKGLSTNDFTTEEKDKLAGIQFATDEEFNAVMDEVFGTAAGA